MAFDPYHIWLGIPPEDQPPNHYRLLAIPELESNPDVIDAGAEQRMVFLRTFQTGDQVQLAEKLLNEVSAARVCLLNTDQKAEYDQQLQAEMQPALVPIPALVQNDPLGIAALQTTPAVPLPSQPTQPIWQQPRMLAAAGGVVVVALLLLVLSSGGDKPSPIRNPEEREAELKRLVDERVKEELVKAEEAAAKAAMEKTAAEKLAVEQAAAKAAMEEVAVEETATKAPMEEAAPEKAVAESVVTLKGHSGSVYSVSFSPDGKRIVSGSHDQTVRIWDTETGTELLTLKGHSGSVASVNFSSDGKRIVSGCTLPMQAVKIQKLSEIKVWDVETGEEMFTLKGDSHRRMRLIFSPDGKQIVSSDANTLKVWDAETGQEVSSRKGPEPPAGRLEHVWALALSRNGKRIATAGRIDKTVKVWDAETGQLLQTLTGHSTLLHSVAFSPDGSRIVSGDHDSMLKVWDAKTGQEMLTLNGHSDGIYIVSFSPDGTRIVTGGGDRTIRVWDTETGQERLALKGHWGLYCVAFSPDGKRIVSGGKETVKIWNVPLLEAAKAAMEKAAAERTAAVKKQMMPAQLALGDPVVNSVDMLLVPIPAGEFQMGGGKSVAEIVKLFELRPAEVELFGIEHPQHLAKITRPFYLAVNEVTQQQYFKVMGTRPWEQYYMKGSPDYPAVYVSHDDAVEFCRRLSYEEGVEYRLPTEAEWEYACRAGTTTIYSFGDDASTLGQYARMRDEQSQVPNDHRVGQKLPNRWSLYDMHGSVAEWCQDWYAPYGSETVVSDPVGPAQGDGRVSRGGAFGFPPWAIRAAARPSSFPPDKRTDFLGFRVVRTYDLSP
jgi:WD40 repeat protein/formylglycine-generating enzyme required for sulfatase activity